MVKFPFSRIYNIIFYFLLFVYSETIAQDKIITDVGDTIECKIQKLEDGFVVYYFPDSIPKIEFTIARYKISKIYYANQIIENTSKKHKYILFKQPDWRADIGLGYAFFLETAFNDFGPDYANFFKPLRNGRMFYAEISKFPDIRFGGGLEFQFGQYNHGQDNIIIFDTLLVFQDRGCVKEEVQIFYLQPKGYYAKFSSTWDFIAGAGINFTYLDRKIEVIDETYRYEGESIGIGISAAIDRKISSHFSVGLRSSLGLVLLSSIRKNGELITLEEGEYFSASQFSMSFGIKYLY